MSRDFVNDTIIRPAAPPTNILQVNLLTSTLGVINVDIEAIDIDHAWSFMKEHGFIDCVVAASGGKKMRMASVAVLGIVERDTSNLAKVQSFVPPKNGTMILPPGSRQQ